MFYGTDNIKDRRRNAKAIKAFHYKKKLQENA